MLFSVTLSAVHGEMQTVLRKQDQPSCTVSSMQPLCTNKDRGSCGNMKELLAPVGNGLHLTREHAELLDLNVWPEFLVHLWRSGLFRLLCSNFFRVKGCKLIMRHIIGHCHLSGHEMDGVQWEGCQEV